MIRLFSENFEVIEYTIKVSILGWFIIFWLIMI